MRNIILSVVGSWQIWVVTIALVIYISLVRYVGRLNNRGYRSAPPPKAKKKKAAPEAAAAPAAPAGAPKTDELGLEEAGEGEVVHEE